MRIGILRIGDLARRTGTTAPTIRYYEQIGLLPEATRASGRRRYGPGAIRTLAVIDIAQRAGLSLSEIQDVLGAARDGKDAGSISGTS